MYCFETKTGKGYPEWYWNTNGIWNGISKSSKLAGIWGWFGKRFSRILWHQDKNFNLESLPVILLKYCLEIWYKDDANNSRLDLISVFYNKQFSTLEALKMLPAGQIPIQLVWINRHMTVLLHQNRLGRKWEESVKYSSTFSFKI